MNSKRQAIFSINFLSTVHRATFRLALLAGLVFGSLTVSAAQAAELRLFAGAGLRQPVDRLIEQYQKKTGNTVLVDYDGSGRQLTKITASREGDLFMPGSHDYIDKLEKQGLVLSRRNIVAHTPVIAVNRKSPASIETLADLCRPGVRVALGDPRVMALGKTAETILARAGLQEKIKPNVAVYGATVKQVALYAAEGTVDAAIIARADALQFKDRLRMLEISDRLYDTEIVAVAVLKTTVNEKAAGGLRDYLSSADAIAVFAEYGFLPLKQNK
jgi:molybdate transport system substrate-binding protein